MAGVRFDWRTMTVVVFVAMAVLLGMLAIADDTPEAKPRPTRPSRPTMTELDFAVWGSDPEIKAYQAVVDDYNASSKDTNVTLSSWPDATAMVEDLRSGEAKPDLYLLPRSELAETLAEKRNWPLLDLLDEREIAIGDDFYRDAVAAFSADDDLQCMPYAISPMVIYYNTKLVDFEKMEAQGLPAPDPDHTAWSFAEFRAAAEFASRPRQRIRGVYIEPTLQGLAPFVYSGGGKLFDDENRPTSLALNDDDSAGAVRQTLEVLRDPRLTLSTRQLEQRSALEWFKRGRVGMIAGFRDLTPELRKAKGLTFDVMPMPSLSSPKTIGELSGICLAAGRPARANRSANFLTYLLSDEAVARVAETGYLQPTSLPVASSAAFQQPQLPPEHATVFTEAVRTIVLPPLIEEGDALGALVNGDIEALLTTPAPGDLRESLSAIDERSREVLDPDYEAESEAPESEAPESGESSGDGR